mmetsp:Transcript_21469/g.52599  ORF Transcript_21469/g.52599 Transcript_21469/m.52599 type:complete len:366 (+) Transcript_21469:2-1099(+)
MKPGELVVLFGLLKAARYNGKLGVIYGPEDGGRYPVHLLEPFGKMIAAKPSNLKRADPVNCTSNEEEVTEKLRNRLPKALGGCIWVPPKEMVVSNVLILLPGLGDGPENFAKMARTMGIPQTGCIAMRPPSPLPYGMGYGWMTSFEDDGELIKPSKGEKRRIESLNESCDLLRHAIVSIADSFRLPSSRIFLLGFSQGAIAAVHTCLRAHRKQQENDGKTPVLFHRLGGVVGLSSSILEEELLSDDKKGDVKLSSVVETTPMLITHGLKDDRILVSNARKNFQHLKKLLRSLGLSKVNEFVNFKEYKNKGHAMISSNEEAKDMHTFFDRYMFIRNLALENDPDIIDLSKNPEILEQLTIANEDVE